MNRTIDPIPTTGLFAVCDPQGNLAHTTVSTKPEEAIDEWLKTEAAMNWLVNLGRACRGETERCLPSWEGFEAKGYSVVPVTLQPEFSHAAHV